MNKNEERGTMREWPSGIGVMIMYALGTISALLGFTVVGYAIWATIS